MQGTSVVRSWSIPEDERSVVRRRGEDVSGKLGKREVKAEIGGTGFFRHPKVLV